MRVKGTTSAPRVERVCPQCGTTYQITASDDADGRRRYCSNACFKAQRAAGNGQVACTCAHCGTAFTVWRAQIKKGRGVHCSRACKAAADTGTEHLERQVRATVACEICGVAVERKVSAIARAAHVYCSVACQDIGATRHPSRVAKPENNVDCVCATCDTAFSIPAAWARKGGGAFCSVACKAAESQGWFVDSYGYIMRRIAPDVWKHEHRIVMQEMMDRALLPTEHVHHIDLCKTNNKPENLILLTTQEHRALHVRMYSGTWSTEFDECVWCGTSEIPHKGRGLCDKCYTRERTEIRNPDAATRSPRTTRVK